MKKIFKKLSCLSLLSLFGVFTLSNGNDVEAAGSVSINDWDTLKTNLRSLQDTSIKLTSDIDFTLSTVNSGLDLPAVYGNKVLDLNGHNIHFTNESTLGGINGILKINESSSLKIINSSSTENYFKYTNNAIFGNKKYGAKDNVINSEWIKTQGFIDAYGDLSLEGSNVLLEMDTKGYAISAKGNSNIDINASQVRTYIGYAVSVIDTIDQIHSPTITLDGNCTLGPRTRSYAGYATSQANGNAFGAGALGIRDTEGTTLNLYDATLCYGIETDLDSMYEDINPTNYKIIEDGVFKEYSSDFNWSFNNVLHDSKYYYYSSSSRNYNQYITRFQKYYYAQVSTIGTADGTYTVVNDDSYTYEGTSYNEWFKLYDKLAYGDSLTFTFNAPKKCDLLIEKINDDYSIIHNDKIEGEYSYTYKMDKDMAKLYIKLTEADTDAPVISDIKAERLTNSYITKISFKSNEAGKVYYGKTEAQALAKTYYSSLNSSNEGILNVGSLDPKNAKYYFMVEDNDGNLTDIFTVDVPNVYESTIIQPENGTISLNRYYTEGEKVYLNNSPKSGYTIDNFIVTNNDTLEEITVENDGKYYFIAPNSDVTVTATLKVAAYNVAYNITASSEDLKNPSLYFSDVITAADYGDTVILNKTYDGFKITYFKIYGVDDVVETDDTITFVMPKQNVTVTLAVIKIIDVFNFDMSVVSEESYVTNPTDSRISMDSPLLTLKVNSTIPYDRVNDVGLSAISSRKFYNNADSYRTSFMLITPTGYIFDSNSDLFMIEGIPVKENPNVFIKDLTEGQIDFYYYYEPTKVEYNMDFDCNIPNLEYSLYCLDANNNKHYVDKMGYGLDYYIEFPGYVCNSSQLYYFSGTSITPNNNGGYISFYYNNKSNSRLTLLLKKKIDVEISDFKYYVNDDLTLKEESSSFSSELTSASYQWGPSNSSFTAANSFNQETGYVRFEIYVDRTKYDVNKESKLVLNGISYSLADITISASTNRYIFIVGGIPTLTKVSGEESTCNKNGYNDYYLHGTNTYSDVYLTEITDLESWKSLDGSLPLGSHVYGEWIEMVEPSCEVDGVLGHYQCEVCHKCFDNEYNELSSLVVSKLGHNYVYYEEIPSTQSTKGTKEHYECDRCLKLFDMDKKETNSNSLVIGLLPIYFEIEMPEYITYTMKIANVSKTECVGFYGDMVAISLTYDKDMYYVSAMAYNEDGTTKSVLINASGTARYALSQNTKIVFTTKLLVNEIKISVHSIEVGDTINDKSSEYLTIPDYVTYSQAYIYYPSGYQELTPDNKYSIYIRDFNLDDDHYFKAGYKIYINDKEVSLNSAKMVILQFICPKLNSKAPTCEESGIANYYELTTDGITKYYSDIICSREIDLEEYALNDGYIDAIGHDYINMSYSFSDDYKTCTATAVCSHDESHVLTITVNTESSYDLEPTCTTSGTLRYTAVFENTLFETQTTTVTVDKLGHDWMNPTYLWDLDENVCIGYIYCSHDSNHPIAERVNLTTSKVSPTCTTAGKITYTAVFSIAGFETQTMDEDLEPLGHEYGEATYLYSKDLSTCTATRVCIHDSTHVITKTVDTEIEVIKPATCEEDGEAQFIAKFGDDVNYITQSVPGTIYKTGHDYGSLINGVDPTYWATGTLSHYECSNCHKYFDLNHNQIDTIIIPKLICEHHSVHTVTEIPATKDSYGVKAYVKCSDCGDIFDLSGKPIENFEEWKITSGRIDKLAAIDNPTNISPSEGDSNLDNNDNEGLGAGAITGIVIGSVALIALAGAGVFIFIKKKR